MEPALTVAVLWLLFAGTHIGLATRRLRAALVARLGEAGFTALFSVIASASFAAAIAYYAAHRTEGAPGLALANVPALRGALMAVTVTGIVLLSAGSVTYPGSPYDLFARTVRAPRGIERVTRHPFFAGVARPFCCGGPLAGNCCASSGPVVPVRNRANRAGTIVTFVQ